MATPYERVRSAARPLATAALNAGMGAGGAFATDTELEKELGLTDLNVRRSAVALCPIVSRRRSTASWPSRARRSAGIR